MTHFNPKDPNFHDRVTASFNRQKIVQTLGLEIANLSAGQIELIMPYSADYTQQHGFTHAGIIATALDNACGYAAFSLMPDDAAVLTVEFKTNLVAPAQGPQFAIHGRVVKPGRTITVCEAQAFSLDDTRRTLIATMTGTLMAIYNRSGITH